MRMRPSIRWITAVLAAIPALAAAECRVASGPGTAALVELYTSEGCSSCPPADHWLSALAAHRDPRVVPIAFHVQYWDSLGWKDRFGDPRFTRRQEFEGRTSGARFIYTPQVVLAGRDFPDWHSGSDFARALDAVNHRHARATIEIASHAGPAASIAGTVSATLAPNMSPANLELVVAVTQDGLASRVTAGENRGEHLSHDFVTRGLASSPVGAGRTSREFSFAIPTENDAARTSVTAFVQDTKTGEVIQALAAPPCP